MILNPSRTHTTFGKPYSFQNSLLKLHNTSIQKYNVQRRRGIEYTWVNPSLKFRSTGTNPIPHLR